MDRSNTKRFPLLSMACGSVLAAAALTISLAGCSGAGIPDVLEWGECSDYATEYNGELQASGALMSSVPTSTDSFPMALVLNQEAINSLFRRLSDTQLPELSESATVLGQRLTASVRPAIPLLHVGGQGACADCMRAEVPFDVGLSMAGFDLPRGAGVIDVQMPVRLVPEGDTRTALVAEFQSIEVLDIELGFASDLAANIFNAVEPLISTALTQFLQSRFENARIFSLDSWQIGRGEVLLAGRGPFVYPEAGTVLIAMQSNLPLTGGTRVETQAQLPPGADIGIMLHPGLLGSMGRRMLYEGVIPQAYDEQGDPQAGGSTLMTLKSIGSSDDGMLRASATLWRTGSLCGAADLSAAIAFSADPQGVTFAMRDLDVSNPRGSGQILAQVDQLASGFIDSLLETLEFTVNYDEIAGGEQASQASVETFQFNVDGRGVSLYLDLID